LPIAAVPTNLLVYKGAIPLLDGGVRLAQLSLSPVVVFKLPAIVPDSYDFGLLIGLDRPAALLSAIESIALSRRFKRSLCGQDWFLSKLKKGAPHSVDHGRRAVNVV
jgi:hypothetical protein